MSTSKIIKLLKKSIVRYTWQPSGVDTYSTQSLNIGVTKDRIRSVIIETGSTNATAMLSVIIDSVVYFTIHQIDGISVSEMAGTVTVYYE